MLNGEWSVPARMGHPGCPKATMLPRGSCGSPRCREGRSPEPPRSRSIGVDRTVMSFTVGLICEPVSFDRTGPVESIYAPMKARVP
jgi:hypothetical protein